MRDKNAPLMPKEIQDASLAQVAAREGVPVDDLIRRWLQEKLDDDLLRRLREAAGANKSDTSLIHEETCSVTMYEMRLRLMSDGRKRGLWVFLKDDSPDRVRNLGEANEAVLLEWPQAEKLHAAMGKAIRKGKPK